MKEEEEDLTCGWKYVQTRWPMTYALRRFHLFPPRKDPSLQEMLKDIYRRPTKVQRAPKAFLEILVVSKDVIPKELKESNP